MTGLIIRLKESVTRDKWDPDARTKWSERFLNHDPLAELEFAMRVTASAATLTGPNGDFESCYAHIMDPKLGIKLQQNEISRASGFATEQIASQVHEGH